MTENFILILISMLFSFLLGLLAIWYIGLKKATEELRTEARKTQLLINQTKRDLKEGTGSAISNKIGEMGIDGLFDELGVPGMLKPLAKGFIENLMKDPAKIEAIASKFGINLKGDGGGKSAGGFQ